MPFVLNGQPHFLAYKGGTGQAEINKITASGESVNSVGVSQLWSGSLGEWSHLAPVTVGGTPRLVAYRTEDGDARYMTVRADGKGFDDREDLHVPGQARLDRVLALHGRGAGTGALHDLQRRHRRRRREQAEHRRHRCVRDLVGPLDNRLGVVMTRQPTRSRPSGEGTESASFGPSLQRAREPG